MDKRGAYFFVIDAVIAGTVLVATLLFIFGTYTSSPEQDTTLRAAEEFMKYLSTTKVREYSDGSVQAFINDGNITDLDNTLMAQMVEFYYKGKTVQLTAIAQDFSQNIVGKERGLIIYINGTAIYNSTYHKGISTLKTSRLALSSKRVSFKRINETTIYGPVWVEAKVWA